jgi:hypothetical protein
VKVRVLSRAPDTAIGCREFPRWPKPAGFFVSSREASWEAIHSVALVCRDTTVAFMPSSAPAMKLSYCTAVNLMVATLRSTEHAHDADPEYLKLMHTWFTLTHATFTLEAVANSLLSQVNLPPIEWTKKERLQLIDKLDFLVHHKHAIHIDRQNLVYRKMCEMIALRNHHVHPKVKAKKFSISSQGRSHHLTLVDEITEHLRIPFNHMTWKPEHADAFATVMIDALNKFFVSDMRMSPHQCEETICSTVLTDGALHFMSPIDLDEVQVRFEQEHGYQFQFLRPPAERH